MRYYTEHSFGFTIFPLYLFYFFQQFDCDLAGAQP